MKGQATFCSKISNLLQTKFLKINTFVQTTQQQRLCSLKLVSVLGLRPDVLFCIRPLSSLVEKN